MLIVRGVPIGRVVKQPEPVSFNRVYICVIL